MTDSELQIKCAEILGWNDFEWRAHEAPSLVGKNPHGTRCAVPNFGTSLDACRKLLEWAAKQSTSLIGNFGRAVLVNIDILGDCIPFDVLIVLLATPRQIAEAFVETFGGKK